MTDQHRMDDEQIIEIVGYDFGVSRRTFVQIIGAGLLFIASADPAGAQQQRDRSSAGRGTGPGPAGLDARLRIGKDGTITLMTGKVEGGQGARAEITQAAAEELHLPVEHIVLIMGDTDLVPDDGITAGSRTTPSTLPAIRSACAAARQLLQAWAKGDAGRTYADLAADPKALEQAAGREVALTPANEWKVLGVATPRPNARAVITGAHQYPSDIIRPGMLYGKVLRPPSFGARLISVDLEKARALCPTAVRDGGFAGVAAANMHLARQALAALEESATWETSPQPSSGELYQYLRQHANVPANPFAEEVAKAPKKLKRTFNIPYIQHCPMEPRAAVAEWDQEGRVTVWTSTQNPFGVRREVAGAFHISQEKVRIIVPDFGGGFGGKHTGETAIEAARLAKAAGKPVAVRWTRAEELTWAYFRPAAVIDIEASLTDTGRIGTWHMVSINPGRAGVESPYRIARSESQAIDSAPPLRQGSYRALAATANNHARESMMDELAAAAGKDPLAFRLDHLDNDRLRAVLELAAGKFEWKQRRAGDRTPHVGIGLACGAEKGGFVAACADVEIDPAKRAIKVRRICQAFECGAIANPSNLRSQNIGCIIMGLGPALREAMAFENGRITNASFWSYQVPRLSDVPALDIHLLDRKDLPSAGGGECPLIAIAPAIRNAVYDATKTWLYDLSLKLPATSAAQR